MRHLHEMRVAGGQPYGWSTGTYAVFEASYHGHAAIMDFKDMNDDELLKAKVCEHQTFMETFFGAWTALLKKW